MTPLRRSILLGATAWATLSGEALACSVVVPAPRLGETIETVVNRVEIRTQQNFRHQASHVFLARVRETAGLPTKFNPVVALKGDKPRRQTSTISREPCGPTTPVPGELRIVFTDRIAASDMPWRPWRWGELVVIGSRRLDEVRDPDLVALLRRAAERDPND